MHPGHPHPGGCHDGRYRIVEGAIAMRITRFLQVLALCAVLTVPATAVNARSHADTVSLSFALWDKNQIPAMQQIIKEFQRLHPNVQIHIEQTPWAGYWNKLATLTAG